ncbi:cytochrome c oxidase copper chaperone [Mauremys reevesii]|uniref:cytochrome c oxidase copper chaperone n=1 Tax=Mauremys reevesii TaxID=260615 RepID=UPI00193FA55D|nr:cytochrome c oxidase copper chaperone [Mauremys reevesii]
MRIDDPCADPGRSVRGLRMDPAKPPPPLKMSSLASASCEPPGPEPQEKKPLKPCCACPETKKARDACIIEKGEEHCGPLIEAHKECMRALGFKV